MQNEEQFLPPAAVDGWLRLARAVVRITADPQERQEWLKWGEMRRAIREMHRTTHQGARAQRMGHFEDGVAPSRNKRFK